MVVGRESVKVSRQKRLSRGNSHYDLLCNGFKITESSGCGTVESFRNPIPIRSFIVPEKRALKVEHINARNQGQSTATMSVEESLQYLDNTLAELDNNNHHEQHAYESESDLLSEVGYASGYTELSVTSDSEIQPKQYGGAARRRKSRQNRNQRYQLDPVLGDLESDSTNDGRLFGSSVTPKTKARTNSGQRRQRERRRQRRQNANRNSWTDSGLSLSKTDSQRSSHGENSPLKRGRSKTSPATLDQDVEQTCDITKLPTQKEVEDKGTSPIQLEDEASFTFGNDQNALTSESENATLSTLTKTTDQLNEPDNSSTTLIASDVDLNVENVKDSEQEDNREMVFALSVINQEDKISKTTSADEVSGRSLNPSVQSLDPNFINIKPTNVNGVVNGTYTPKEKEILKQVFENARNSGKDQSVLEHSPFNGEHKSSHVKTPSPFPLPSHMDYPLCMYRMDTKVKKVKKSRGIISGIQKLKEGITNRKKSTVNGDEARVTNARGFKTEKSVSCDQTNLPPSKSVEKKKNFLKRIFKSRNNNAASKSSSRKSGNFSRDRFGSSRSFTGSIGQLWSRGSRARSQSMENLKNVFKRDRGTAFIKRSNSSISLAGKLPRSLSISSLISRNGNRFTRQGSVASIAASVARQQANHPGFRRVDSVRSLQGGFDIATRLMHARNECYDSDNISEAQSSYANEYVPFRTGWRPSSRISRPDTYYYEPQQYFEDDYERFDDCYVNDGPCSCCCDDRYIDDGFYYNDNEYSANNYGNEEDVYALQNFVNTQSMAPQDVHSLYKLEASMIPSYYSPVSRRADDRMVIAPLNVQVTRERQAQRMKISRKSQVFDTMV